MPPRDPTDDDIKALLYWQSPGGPWPKPEEQTSESCSDQRWLQAVNIPHHDPGSPRFPRSYELTEAGRSVLAEWRQIA
jgi:hypothetical protein